MTRELRRKRVGSDSDAIVFNGPVNTRFGDGVIHFPTDRPPDIIFIDDQKKKNNDDDIDLSGSFTPSKPAIFEPIQGAVVGTFAHCGIFSTNGTLTAGTASSGVFTFPNGTQVSYSTCHVAVAIKS